MMTRTTQNDLKIEEGGLEIAEEGRKDVLVLVVSLFKGCFGGAVKPIVVVPDV